MRRKRKVISHIGNNVRSMERSGVFRMSVVATESGVFVTRPQNQLSVTMSHCSLRKCRSIYPLGHDFSLTRN